ncbi:MAG: acyl-CoA dehydrogenase family protein [Motilibacteraceae bacterium]
MSHGDLTPPDQTHDLPAAVAAAVAPLDHPTAVAAHPAARRAAALARDVLEPSAQEVDVEGVTRERIDLVAGAGLLGLAAPPADGGEGAPADVVRAVTEELSGACGSTWFVATQHGMPLQYALRTENGPLRDRLLPAMGRGELLAGVAVSHLRRRGGTPPVRARRDGDGWVVDGTVGWFTGWGLADVLLLGAVTDDERALFAFLPAHEQPGLTPGAPMALAAMEATGTTTLHLDGLRVPDTDVADLAAIEPWLEADAAKTANVTPAVFGLLRTIVRRLATWADATGSVDGLELAAALAAEGGGLRSEAYALIDDVPAEAAVEDRLALRAAALELLNRSAAALVASGAGMSMSLRSPNQRLAREALFHLIQAQTAPVRTALLRRYADLAPTLPSRLA